LSNNSIVAVLDRPDQGRVHADLAAFFGSRAEAYLKTYEKMRAATGWRRLQSIGWCWPAFFSGFAWFFYRKMYVLGTIVVVVPVVLGLVINTGTGIVAVVIAMYGKGYYVQSALRHVLKADEIGLVGQERSDYLRGAGGVSIAAGVIGGFIYASALAVTLVGTLGEYTS
jgi:hypothetical protein